jgi:hypothetical protein
MALFAGGRFCTEFFRKEYKKRGISQISGFLGMAYYWQIIIQKKMIHG